MEKTQTAKNFLWNLIGTGINSVMSFLYVVAATRINGIETQGMFSVCLSLSFILFTFSNLGTRVYEVSDKQAGDSLYFTLKIFTCAASLLVGFCYCLIFGFNGVKTTVVITLVLVRCIEALSDTLYAVLQKNERLDLVGISYTVKNSAALILFIIVDILTKDIRLASLSMLLATLAVYFLFDTLLCRKYQKVGICAPKGIFKLIKSISYFLLFNLVMIIIANVPRLIADTRYGDGEMGNFSIIMMIPTVMAVLGQFVIQPSLMGLVRNFEQKDLKSFQKTANRLLLVLTFCAVICCGGIYFLGPPVLGFIMGVDLSSFAAVMVIAILAGMFNIFTTLISNLLTVMKHTKKQLFLYVGTLVIEIAAIYIGVITDNLINVFIAYLAVMAVQFILFLIYYLLVLKKEEREI